MMVNLDHAMPPHPQLAELKVLQRATTRNGGRALNYTINRIPTGQIKDYLAIATENRGLALIKVNPAGTSKYTVEWKDKLGYKLDTHQLASYLIGRRGLGYSIRRKAYFDSGQDMPKTLSGSLNSGKDGTLQGIQSPLVT